MIQNHNRGFTLLFASLVGALLLAVGMAILSIVLKQLILTSAGKATQQSFYTADAATECALFLAHGGDSKDSTPEHLPDCFIGFFPLADGISCLNSTDPAPASPEGVKCMGRKITISDPITITDGKKSTFTFDDTHTTDSTNDTGVSNDMCFTVTVINKTDGTNIIQTRGYNTCKAGPNRFERAIKSTNRN